jgi:predicted CXXCH cytochrome family protein
MRIAVVVTLLLAVVLFQVQALENPHPATHGCLLDFQGDCDSVCLICHLPPESAPVDFTSPWNPQGLSLLEVYGHMVAAGASPEDLDKLIGDIATCTGCHATYLEEGNHPVGVDHAVDGFSNALVMEPEGPKLLCESEGGACKLQCSTCHDVHEEKTSLLRMENTGSALCVACHRK